MHAIVPRGVLGDEVQAHPIARETGAGQHLVEDLRGREVLEDPARLAVLQPPDPRHERDLVELILVRLTHELDFGDHAVDPPRRLGPRDLQQTGAIDQGGEVELRTRDLEAKLEKSREPLAPDEPHHT